LVISKDGRQASTAVDLKVVDVIAPVVVLINPVRFLSFATTNKLKLVGTISTPLSCDAIWSISSGLVELALASLTAISAPISAGSLQQSVALIMVSNSLPVESVLTFTLRRGLGVSSINITTNGPPLPGVFQLSPNVGIELTTSFLFSASEWSDPELPLAYEFRFSSAADATVIVGTKAAMQSITTTLPASNSLTCTVNVFDALGSFAMASKVISVIEIPVANITATMLRQLEASQGSINAVKYLLLGQL
jgi:hypothetical protein